MAVYNHWTGLVDWTGGLTLKIIFMFSNNTHSPVGLCGSPAALFLATYMVGNILVVITLTVHCNT